MSKKRTRKQKIKAKHNFNIKWDEGNSKLKFEPNVKRQLKNEEKETQDESENNKISEYSVKTQNLATIKKDIAKSLILASLIFASEIVLYLIWR